MPLLKFGKIFCFLLLLILIASGFNFILFSNSIDNLETIKLEPDSEQMDSNTNDNHQLIENSEAFTKSSMIYSNSVNEIYANAQQTEDYTSLAGNVPRTRSNETYDYDLMIFENITVNYTGFVWWWVKIGETYYPYYIAGEIGKETVFTITVKNIGKKPIDNNDGAYLTISITDYYGHSTWEQRDYIGHLSPGYEKTMDFTWKPSYSNRFNLTCNLYFDNDQNLSNNERKFYNLFTKKWNDNLEDGNIEDWSGDVGSNAWHLTDTIENDPNPNFHTPDYVFYHGLEEDGESDDYGERNNFDLITPEIDLRRFDPFRPAFLNFNFFGSSTVNKDKFTIEGYKPSSNEWYPIEIKFYGGETVNESNNPSWNFWRSGFYIGIPIDAFAGELVRFKIHWESDHNPEELTGFYFDDFFIYGHELPPPEYDLNVESITIKPEDTLIMAGNDIQILANITNFGQKPASNIRVNAEVKDFTGRIEPTTPEFHIISKLITGNSEILTWNLVPTVGGIYSVNVSIELDSDEIPENNYRISDAIEVYKYYNSFEHFYDDWHPEDAWVRGYVIDDPAWFVSKNNINGTDANGNLDSSLYSPIIDLDGAQTNPIYKAAQVRIGFNWLDVATASENIYFEYALDHTDNWQLFDLPADLGFTNSENIITGTATGQWQSWLWGSQAKQSTDTLFGHHVQFRWRFSSNLDVESAINSGFYIDDFSLWVIQEQFGRPQISECIAKPKTVLNDSRDIVDVSCAVIDYNSPINEVRINLEPLGGPSNQIMIDDKYYPDIWLGYYYAYPNITLTIPPSIPEGEYILKITATNYAGLFDNNYVKVIVRENSAPQIIAHTPLNSSIVMLEDEYLMFSVEAMDTEDGSNLEYEWYLNSTKILDWEENYFEFKTDFHDEYSAGTYILRVEAADHGFPPKTDFFEWNIEVLDVLPDFEIKEDEVELSNYNVTVDDIVEIDVLIHNLNPPPERNVTVYFIQQSTDSSIGESVFEDYQITEIDGYGKEYIHVTWIANLSYSYLKVWVDPENSFIELDEENNDAIIKINVSLPPAIIEPEDDYNTTNSPEAKVPYILYLIVIGTTCTLLGLFIAIGTEFGNYRLFLMFAPLYSRVTGDKILEHKLRSKIYMHIRAHPGDHYRSIMTTLKIKNGTLVHHLARLEQEELIKSERDGYFKRFYPIDMRIPKSEVGMYYPEGIATYNIGEHQLSEIQMRIIGIIRGHPGLTQKEIAQRIKESRRVVNYHIKLLEQHDLIRVIKIGRETQCFIIEATSGS